MKFPEELKVDVEKVIKFGNYSKMIKINCIDRTKFNLKKNENKETQARKRAALLYFSAIVYG